MFAMFDTDLQIRAAIARREEEERAAAERDAR